MGFNLLQKQYDNEQLIAFLAVLIEKAGGTIVVDDLLKYEGKNITISVDLDKKHGKATLTTKVNPGTQFLGHFSVS